MVICDTKSRRELTGSEYGQRRAQCEAGARRLGLQTLREITPEAFYRREGELPASLAGRCRFIVEENDRVLQLATALMAGDRRAITQLTAAAFQGACDLYEIIVPPMRAMMQAMLAGPGIIGARQAGAGFGGCLVAFVEAKQLPAFVAFVTKTDFNATQTQPGIYPVDAAAGAGLMIGPKLQII